jgi:hypothetical protein
MIIDNGMVKWYNNGTTLYHFQKVSNPQSVWNYLLLPIFISGSGEGLSPFMK